MFEELTPPYSTIVVDPPWHYSGSMPKNPGQHQPGINRKFHNGSPLPYSSLTLNEIKALPIGDLAIDGRCVLWVTDKYLRHGWDVLEAWGFKPQARTFVWCKKPMGTLPVTTEFFLIGKKGRPPKFPWIGTTWYSWQRQPKHSRKPDEFFTMIESWCSGPFLELFARNERLGWDVWGDEIGGVV